MNVLHEPETDTDELAHTVIGAAIEVHRVLGPGFLEEVYEQALCVELRLRGIPFERQKPAKVEYKASTWARDASTCWSTIVSSSS